MAFRNTGVAWLAVAATALFAHPAQAAQVLEFRSYGGWYAGGLAGEQCAEGVCVSLQIRSVLGEPNKIYAVARYRPQNNDYWCGGSRVSRNYPADSFFTKRARGGNISTWGEHMPAGTTGIFVYVRQENC